jgi:hypothetical protein
MDVSELRKRILRALDDARKEAGARRAMHDEAARAYDAFLEQVAVPLFRQAVIVLKTEGHLFTVYAPAGSARLVSAKSPETFIELVLDTSGPQPEVLGRVSVARGREGRVDERPLAPGTSIADLTDDDVSQFLVRAIPALILR